MPRHCVAAGCDSVSEKEYSFHKYSKDKPVLWRWVNAGKRNGVAGMAHPQILSCASGILKMTVI